MDKWICSMQRIYLEISCISYLFILYETKVNFHVDWSILGVDYKYYKIISISFHDKWIKEKKRERGRES